MRLCALPGCHDPHVARGWCRSHYDRWRKHGDPLKCRQGPGVCSIPGCNRRSVARGWCQTHYMRWVRNDDPMIVKPRGGRHRPLRSCTVAGCNKPHEAHGLCRMHYMGWWRNRHRQALYHPAHERFPEAREAA